MSLLKFALGASILVSTLTASSAQTDSIDAGTFSCIRDLTPVRGFYVDNIEGDLQALSGAT